MVKSKKKQKVVKEETNALIIHTFLLSLQHQIEKSMAKNLLNKYVWLVETQVQTEGKRQVTRTIPYFNLDMIISVGYRVNSKRGVKFRQWANLVLPSTQYRKDLKRYKSNPKKLADLKEVLGILMNEQPIPAEY